MQFKPKPLQVIILLMAFMLVGAGSVMAVECGNGTQSSVFNNLKFCFDSTKVSLNNSVWLDFNGNSTWIQSSFNLNYSNPITIHFKFKTTGVQNNGAVYDDSGSSNKNGTTIYFSNNLVYIRMYNSSGTAMTLGTTNNFVNNNWFDFTYLLNSTASNLTYSAETYVNSYLANHGSPNSMINRNNVNLKSFGKSIKNNVFFNGSLDDISIYNRLLTDEEIYIQDKGYLWGNFATISDMNQFTRYNATNKLLNNGGSTWDNSMRELGNLLFNETGNGGYKLTYSGYNGTYTQNNSCIGWANSSDGVTWTKQGKILNCGGNSTYTFNSSEDPFIVYNGSMYFLYVEDKEPYPFQNISLFTSTDFINWQDQGAILSPSVSGFDSQDVSSPTVLYENGKFYLWYEGRNTTNTGEIGLAISNDGIIFVKQPDNPYVIGTLYIWDNDELVPDGIIKNGTYYLTYHAKYTDANLGFVSFTNITDKLTYTKSFSEPINSFTSVYYDISPYYISGRGFRGISLSNGVWDGNLLYGNKIYQSVSNDSLVIKLRLDENNGSSILDSSSNNAVTNITNGNWSNNFNTSSIRFYNYNDTYKSIINIYGLESSLIHNSTSICNGSASTVSQNTGDLNITLNPLEPCYILPNFNLTEGVTRENSPIWFCGSSDTNIKICSNITNEVTSPVLIQPRASWGSDCENVNELKYTPHNGPTVKYTGSSARDICKQLTTTGYALTINQAADSNELDISISTTQLSSTILKVLIGLICLIVLIIAFAYFYVTVSENWDSFSGVEFIKYAFNLLLVIVLAIALITYIAGVI